MSRLGREVYRRKLNRLLGFIPDREFFALCWAIQAIQRGREAKARWFRYPKEAATEDLMSKWAVHPFFLETLLNECLAGEKDRKGRTLRDARTFDAILPVLHALKRLENAEDGVMLARVSVLDTMPRLIQRQIGWQREALAIPPMYRSAFIYGGERSQAHFAATKGFSLSEFTKTAFLLRVLFEEAPRIRADDRLAGVGVSKGLLRAVLDQISLGHDKARVQAHDLRAGNDHVSYKPSLLRTFPCVEFVDGLIAAPMPDLVTVRGSTGLFYDVAGGPEPVRNEIARRFEIYCLDFLTATLPGMAVSGDFKYPLQKGKDFDTPDVLIRSDGKLVLIGECKATRMSYRARFAEDPAAADPRGYGEMAKGVFQIWRFVSHCRRGLVPSEQLERDVRGIVITLDTWLTMGGSTVTHVLERAGAMADARDPDILAADRIPVIFCPIADLEETLETATATSFLEAVRANSEQRFKNHMLPGVHRDLNPEPLEARDYPFGKRVSEVLPWWDELPGGPDNLP